jgi:hypothetical protein
MITDLATPREVMSCSSFLISPSKQNRITLSELVSVVLRGSRVWGICFDVEPQWFVSFFIALYCAREQ